MRKSVISNSAIILGGFLLLASCASYTIAPSRLAAPLSGSLSVLGEGAGNTLIYQKTAISLPEGWNFFLSGDPAGQELYRFADQEGKITGIVLLLEASRLDGGFQNMEKDLEKTLEQIYAQRLPEGETLHVTVPTEAVTGRACIIHGGNSKAESSFISLFLFDGEDLYVVELTGPESVLFEQAETLAAIIHRFSPLKNGGFVMRSRPEYGLRFHSFVGTWQWVEDLPEGVSLFSAVEGKDVLVSIRRPETGTPRLNVADLVSGKTMFEDTLTLNSKLRELSVQARMAGPETGLLTLQFEVDAMAYQVDIQVSGVTGVESLMEIYRSRDLQMLFAEHLLFDEKGN